MTLTARALNTHEMAVEAALARLQRRWARLGIQPASAETDLVAALLPTMMEVATLDTADVAKQLPEVVVAAGAPAAFVARLAAAVRARLAASASGVVTALRRGDSPHMVARAQVAGVRSAGTQALAAAASSSGPVEIVWHASGTCTHKFCLGLDKTVIPFGGTFDGGLDGPPAHPGCQCSTTVKFSPAFDRRLADAMLIQQVRDDPRSNLARVLRVEKVGPLAMALDGGATSLTAVAGDVKERVSASIKSRQALRDAGMDPDVAVAVTAAADGPGWLAVVMIEGVETPDYRLFEKGSSKWRVPPLPLTWSPNSDDHELDVVVGKATEIWREGDEIMARGTYDTSPAAVEARRVVDEQLVRWVSIVYDPPREWELRETPEGCAEESLLDPIGSVECKLTEVVLDFDIAKICIVDHPAIPGAVIVPGDATIPPLVDGGRSAADVVTDELAEPAPEVVAACAARATPPGDWFAEPDPGPVDFTDDGRIFGYFAPDVEHISGFGRPPKGADYDSAFHIHDLVLDDGSTIQVGYVVGGIGHPDDVPRTLSVAEAQRYYAGPGSVITAMVRVGESEHGTWMAGAIAADLSEDERHQLRTFKFSGDWRRVKGESRWKLVAIASGILVPGYPAPRSLVAAGTETSLILVGA